MIQPDLFGDRGTVELGPGAVLLGGFACDVMEDLRAGIIAVSAAAPFRHLETPGGRRMSVAMTNCGALGWISDRRGYRYGAHDAMTGRPWPAMPPVFTAIAGRAALAAGYGRIDPEACLINRYEPGARLSLHQDRDEEDLATPIVSISIGLPATFLWGGAERSDRPRRIAVHDGDVVVWGGASRLAFHGVAPLPAGNHPETGGFRYNLTFRRVRAAG